MNPGSESESYESIKNNLKIRIKIAHIDILFRYRSTGRTACSYSCFCSQSFKQAARDQRTIEKRMEERKKSQSVDAGFPLAAAPWAGERPLYSKNSSQQLVPRSLERRGVLRKEDRTHLSTNEGKSFLGKSFIFLLPVFIQCLLSTDSSFVSAGETALMSPKPSSTLPLFRVVPLFFPDGKWFLFFFFWCGHNFTFIWKVLLFPLCVTIIRKVVQKVPCYSCQNEVLPLQTAAIYQQRFRLRMSLTPCALALMDSWEKALNYTERIKEVRTMVI